MKKIFDNYRLFLESIKDYDREVSNYVRELQSTGMNSAQIVAKLEDAHNDVVSSMSADMGFPEDEQNPEDDNALLRAIETAIDKLSK